MINLLEKALNLYRAITPSDGTNIQETNAEADRIFFDNNQPTQVQNIDENNYKNIYSRDLGIQWNQSIYW